VVFTAHPNPWFDFNPDAGGCRSYFLVKQVSTFSGKGYIAGNKKPAPVARV